MMINEFLLIAHNLEMHGEECETLALNMKHENPRETMLRLASSYEKLSKHYYILAEKWACRQI